MPDGAVVVLGLSCAVSGGGGSAWWEASHFPSARWCPRTSSVDGRERPPRAHASPKCVLVSASALANACSSCSMLWRASFLRAEGAIRDGRHGRSGADVVR